MLSELDTTRLPLSLWFTLFLSFYYVFFSVDVRYWCISITVFLYYQGSAVIPMTQKCAHHVSSIYIFGLCVSFMPMWFLAVVPISMQKSQTQCGCCTPSLHDRQQKVQILRSGNVMFYTLVLGLAAKNRFLHCPGSVGGCGPLFTQPNLFFHSATVESTSQQPHACQGSTQVRPFVTLCSSRKPRDELSTWNTARKNSIDNPVILLSEK